MAYKLVRVSQGVHSVHSLEHAETFHPVVGPAAEAEALYVKQFKLPERLRKHQGEFIIWDVGLGAAGNALTVFRKTQEISSNVRVLSFEHTLTPLQFALEHSESLGYPQGYESQVKTLLNDHAVVFQNGEQKVSWEVRLGDFPTFVGDVKNAGGLSKMNVPAPHAILFDPFSPAKNPTMWTAGLFQNLFACLDPNRPCGLATYTRSTICRATLLLAGFFVGVGHATGEKEETTIAANSMELIEEPLGKKFLERARVSSSAEPLWEPVYRQAPMAVETWKKLAAHPQFS